MAIDHRDGWWSGYYHLTGVSVSNGQPVAAGQVLGRIGRTTPCGGSANPAHVHFFLKYVPQGRTIGDIFQHTSVDVDLRGLALAGWTIAGRQWSACMTFQATGQRACAGQNIVNHGNTPIPIPIPTPTPNPGPGPQPGPNLLQNASFNTGNPAPWFRNSRAGNVNIVDYVTPSLSEDGGGFLATNTSVPGGSIAQDLTVTPLPGHTYTFSVWLRSRDGTPMSTTVATWALGTPNVSASRVVTIGGTWRQVAVSLTVPSAGCRTLRAEVYMTTTGHTLNLDNASFTA